MSESRCPGPGRHGCAHPPFPGSQSDSRFRLNAVPGRIDGGRQMQFAWRENYCCRQAVRAISVPSIS